MTTETFGMLSKRREFLTGPLAAIVSGNAHYGANPSGRQQQAHVSQTLQGQKLAWAGIRLQLEDATLFVELLIDPNVCAGPY
jgi:hypothetical protein